MLACRRFPRRTFCLRLPADLHVRLRAVAALEGISANDLACRGLEAWLRVLERRPPEPRPAAQDEPPEET
jgi:hypothetical protein